MRIPKARIPQRRIPFVTGAAVIVAAALGVSGAYFIPSSISSSSASNTEMATSAQSLATSTISNTTINPSALPLGDGHVSSTPKSGYVDSCVTNFGNGRQGPSANVSDPWISTSSNTWDSLTKPAVEGSVSWPNAEYSISTSGSSRVIKSNDLPIDHTTGVFPISKSDPVYQYDTNPNSITPQTIDWTLPLNPTAATTPSCTSMGPIGILSDGVLLFNGLDAQGHDAAAHEVQDACGEHPESSGMLHHHDVPSCILDNATGSSTLVGYASDGYGIYAERDANGNLLTNSSLDACHGRTSEVMWNGTMQSIYHYDATLEYPYTVGCFHGTPTTGSRSAASGGATGGGAGSGPGGGPWGSGPGGGAVRHGRSQETGLPLMPPAAALDRHRAIQ